MKFTFIFINVLIFDKIALQLMNQYYVILKVQFDFALEVWFSILYAWSWLVNQQSTIDIQCLARQLTFSSTFNV